MEDAELVERAAAGDEVAFELLVRRHVDATWRLARALLHDDFAADEAVQDTFLKGHRALGGYRGEAAFETWLLAICRRVCLDRLRLKHAAVVPLELARTERAYDDRVVTRLAVEEAVRDLPLEEREAFTLVHVLGYSREEAAQILHSPASTVRSRVTRACERLADAIADQDSIANGG